MHHLKQNHVETEMQILISPHSLPTAARLSTSHPTLIFPHSSFISATFYCGGSHPSLMLYSLSLLYFLILIIHAFGLSFSAPEACGNNRTIVHATALFGPKLQAANVFNARLFAPRPQANGLYLSTNDISATTKISHASINSPIPPPKIIYPTQPIKLRNVFARIFTRRTDDLLRAHPSASATVSAQAPPNAITAISQTKSLTIQYTQHSSTPLLQPLFNACTPLTVSSDIHAIKGNVAVVTRGVCDFSTKVVNMQHAGAIAVVVVNFPDTNRLQHMKLNESIEQPIINIPAVMINYKSWTSIAPCQNQTTVSFTSDGEASFNIDYGREALNWAMMRGVALWILCQCGVNVVRYKRRTSEFRARADAIAALPVQTYSRPQQSTQNETNHESESENQDSPKPNQFSLTDSFSTQSQDNSPVSSIHENDNELTPLLNLDEESSSRPSSSNSSSLGLNQNEDIEPSDSEDPLCAVCLDPFRSGEQVRELPCSHLYHRKCIDPWFQSSSNCCPLCKREVPDLPPLTTQFQYGSMNI